MSEAAAIPGAGSARIQRGALASEALCEVLWEALREELAAADGDASAANGRVGHLQRAAALATGLADVTRTLALLAGEAQRPAGPPSADAEASAGVRATENAPARPPRAAAVMIDEHEEHRGEREWRRGEREERYGERDERPGDAVASGELIAGALRRFERDRRPFAVLLIEVLDHDHGSLADRPDGRPAVEGIEAACTRALDALGARAQASFALEPPSRLWLGVPDTDRAAAGRLIRRLLAGGENGLAGGAPADATGRYFAALSTQASPSSSALASPSRRARAAPTWAAHEDRRPELAVGGAVCPDDGTDAPSLALRAQRELARARGAGTGGMLAGRV